jgi:hypothetical protein
MMIRDDDKDAAAKLSQVFGPEQIDHFIREAIMFCAMALPQERRTADEVEKQIRRMVDRALKDFREDKEAFK